MSHVCSLTCPCKTYSSYQSGGFVGGGNSNGASGIGSVVIGGQQNNATNDYAFIGGGYTNKANGFSSVVAGGGNTNSNQGNTASGNFSAILGGSQNVALNLWSVVVGGNSNGVYQSYGFVGGGNGNGASGISSVVIGGQQNTATNDYAFVGGGTRNTASGQFAIVVGGGSSNNSQFNLASADYATIVGGNVNTATGANSFIGAGRGNSTSGPQSCIPGGTSNTAAGSIGFVCGQSSNDGGVNNRFVWGDVSGMGTTGYSGPNAALVSPNSVWFGCGGAGTSAGAPVYTIFTATGRTNNSTAGVQLVQGGTSWNSLSDVNTKNLHGELEYLDVLDKIDTMPIYAYNYNFNPVTNICRGPTAQDWHSRFPSDKNPLMIDTMDLDGITLAALKGLSIQHKELSNQHKQLQNDHNTLSTEYETLKTQTSHQRDQLQNLYECHTDLTNIVMQQNTTIKNLLALVTEISNYK